VAKAKASIDANVRIRPRGGQVVLVALLVLSGASFLGSFALLWAARTQWWLFFTLGAAFAAAAYVGWLLSRRDQDWAGGTPLVFEHPDGGMVKADPRTLTHPSGISLLRKALDLLETRRPLPKPDGLVGPDNQPLPNTQDAAAKRVDAVNALLAKQAAELPALLSAKSQPVELPKLESPTENMVAGSAELLKGAPPAG
jgi:hypothetical protein